MFLSHKALAVCYSSHRKLTCLLPGAPSGATASAVSPRSRQSVCGGTQLQHAGTAGAGSSTVWPAQPLPGAPAPRACPRADGRPMRSEATWPGSPYRSRPGCSHGHLGSPAGAGGGRGNRAPATPPPPAPPPAEARGRPRAVREDEPRAAGRGGCSGPRGHAGGDGGGGDGEGDGAGRGDGRSPGGAPCCGVAVAFSWTEPQAAWRWPARSVLGPGRPRDLSDGGDRADTAPLPGTPGRTSP